MARTVLTEEIFRQTYIFRRLKRGEKVESFDCGDPDLNDFILNEAPLYRDALLAVSYVAENKLRENMVCAYFSLANDRISITDFESKTEFNRFRKHRFVNEKRLKSYPAVKLARFGIHRQEQGSHLGTFLIDFVKSYFIVDNKTGCRFLTVDAYVDAVPFYLKNGFAPLTIEENDSPVPLLYFDLAGIADDSED